MKKYLLPFLFVSLAACSQEPTPDEVMDEFVDAWNERDFAQMYTYISEETQDDIDQETFVERYETIYESVEAEDLSVTTTAIPEEEEEEEAPRPYEVSMQTVAGEVAFDGEADFVEEETEDGDMWKINWDSSFIFPELEDGDTVEVISEEPERGEILDQDEDGLAVNTSVDEVGLVPGEMDEDTVEEVSEITDVSEEDIETELEADWVGDETFVPVTKLQPGEGDTVEALLESDGVMIQESTSRYYPLAEEAAHITGYIREVNADDLEELPSDEYDAGSVVGSSGLENVYEETLRGSTGWEIIIPESEEVIAEKEVEDGEDVVTTIDADFQESMFSEMDGDSGAGVALHPETGETIGLVSTPTYDPNHFVFGWPEGAFEEANEDPESPFSANFNNLYSPGSTIKPLTASIALEDDSLDAEEVKNIEGESWQPDDSWGEYEVTRVSDRLTEVDLEDALITSDNIYFAQAALDTGSSDFAEGMQHFGFEENVPYEFPVSESELADNGLDEDMLLADTGYGQGEMLMSPLHLAAAFTPFLNDGDMLAPTLEVEDESPEIWHESVTPSEDIDIITEGLRGVVEDDQGSAYEPVMDDITIAGKTGTAELKTSQEDENTEDLQNGWFVAYDYEDEGLLVSMMIEDVADRGGSAYTVEKVKHLFE
ncbi:penicillin-binding transpeptidase domain-containing protein [Natribacillus halophilus]|uniref:serine-type D-Ala-D-Ala carboxypeptidase n=1 Tax=Natribacillus halophilus TaxID=549003 RepID=A0A1G8PGN1_9BACI|nr:penicillin-binding transpeptidase domain-containing protein [Natribacillus halophilus]SDI91649.1 penicillin-binding protein [Natribacillus halophilus]